MARYRAIVHYNFKKGHEEQGLKFLENELLKKAQQMGCHYIEFLRDERDPTHVVGIGVWGSLEEARQFQSIWDGKEKELARHCMNSPKREFYKLMHVYNEKTKKAA